MATLKDITTPVWQLSTSNPGEIVQGYDSLAQSLRTICSTPRGSIPLMPEFGIDVSEVQDRPISGVAAFLKKEITAQVRTFEPRIEIQKFAAVADPQAGTLTVTIVWRAKNTPLSQTNIINITY